MKRIWIGIGLLAVMLAAGLWVSEDMERTHTAIAQDLDRAALLAQDGRWRGAQSILDRAEKNWERRRPVSACFAEHEVLDEIDSLFAQLRIYSSAKDEISCSACCVSLAQRLNALGQCHKLSLWNLL